MKAITKIVLFMIIYMNLACSVFAQDSESNPEPIFIEYVSQVEEVDTVNLSDFILPEGVGPIDDLSESVEPAVVETNANISEEDIELIALVTMAEAEGECEEGKRLVIDTILNRMDSEYFPDTIYEVIYQPNQFSSMWNGRVDRCEVRDDICQLVREELASKTNYDVVFFTAGGYSNYGTPMFQVEHHFFSSY